MTGRMPVCLSSFPPDSLRTRRKPPRSHRPVPKEGNIRSSQSEARNMQAQISNPGRSLHSAGLIGRPGARGSLVAFGDHMVNGSRAHGCFCYLDLDLSLYMYRVLDLRFDIYSPINVMVILYSQYTDYKQGIWLSPRPDNNVFLARSLSSLPDY